MLAMKRGRELLDFIEELGELDWLKFESRYPVIKIKGENSLVEDRSSSPPYTSFRFKNEDCKIIEKLKLAVENYQGKVQWIMEGYQRISFPDTTNWTIYPKKVSDTRKMASDNNLTTFQYMEKIEPEFGSIAYDDLLELTAYLRKNFN